MSIDGVTHDLQGVGNGPIDAFVRALREADGADLDVRSYAEHSLGSGAEARAVAYIQIANDQGATYFGAGIDTNIELASIKALISALNRSAQAPGDNPAP